MNRRRNFPILLLMLLSLCGLMVTRIELSTSGIYAATNLDSGISYGTIQEAIDASETIAGDTIIVQSGIHYEHLVINKSIVLVGMQQDYTIIDGNGTGTIVHISVDNVVVRNLTIIHGQVGILLERSDNSVILANNVSSNQDGIHVRYSDNALIAHNFAESNKNRSIFVTNSIGFEASNNRILGTYPGYGLNANASANGLLALNYISQNYFDGLGLSTGSHNITVTGNTIQENIQWGIWVDTDCSNNVIYHNNIVGNNRQASALLTNHWDNGFEGNYWSNYTGHDANMDGIGDEKQVLDADNVDNYPLMGRYSNFETLPSYRVGIISNSTVTDFQYTRSPTTSAGTFRVENSTLFQKTGFCRIQMPHVLMTQPFNITVDGNAPAFSNVTIRDDGISRWMYFAYDQSMHHINVQGTAIPYTVPPVINVESPRNRIYPLANIHLTFTIDALPSWMGYSLDNNANVTVSGNTTMSDLTDGNHSLRVYANDTFGNMGRSDLINFRVLVRFPIVVILSPSNRTYNSSSVLLSFTIDEPVSWMAYSLDDHAGTEIAGNTTITDVADGSHTIIVVARDFAGNQGNSSKVHFTINTSMPSEENPVPVWEIVMIAVVVLAVLAFLAYWLRLRKRK